MAYQIGEGKRAVLRVHRPARPQAGFRLPSFGPPLHLRDSV